MMRMLAVAAVFAWVGALAHPGWAQTAPQKPGPAPTSREQPQAGSRPRGTESPLRPAGEDRKAPVTVDADHLETLQKEGLVIFTGNVIARQNSSTQYASRMEVYLDAKGDRILRTVSTGGVRIITKDCRTGTAQRAEYYDLDQRMILIGNARVWQDENVVTGERITIFLAEDRSVVEGGKQERVKAIFHPRPEEPDKPTPRRAPEAPCQ